MFNNQIKNIQIQQCLDNILNVRKLISKGADVNATNYFGKTPVHLAAERG